MICFMKRFPEKVRASDTIHDEDWISSLYPAELTAGDSAITPEFSLRSLREEHLCKRTLDLFLHL